MNWVARIFIAAAMTHKTSGIFENVLQSMLRRCHMVYPCQWAQFQITPVILLILHCTLLLCTKAFYTDVCIATLLRLCVSYSREDNVSAHAFLSNYGS